MGAPAYLEHRPTALEAWAECVWERRAGGVTDVARVIPDGCMDLVWSPDRGLVVAGPNTSAFLAGLPAGGSALGVRLHPACAPALLTLSAAALRDAGAPAGEILGDEGKRLEDELAEAGEASARRSVLLSWLRQRARVARPPDPLASMVARGLSADPATRVAVLARHLGVTERRLHRHVVAEIGYGPKRLGRVLRLRRALAEVRAGADLAEAAFAAGYFDQSHFTGDCGELAGAPPTVVVGH